MNGTAVRATNWRVKGAIIADNRTSQTASAHGAAWELAANDVSCRIWYSTSRTVSDDDVHRLTLMIARSALSRSSKSVAVPTLPS
jgi:hypothetical protein